MLMKILFDVMDRCFSRGLFIYRDGGYTQKKIKYTFSSMPDSYKLNYYFGIDIFWEETHDADSINKVIKEGVIYKKYKNIEKIRKIFDFLLCDNLVLELQHISNTIENSLAAQIYLENCESELLADVPSEINTKKGNLEKCREHVHLYYEDTYIREKDRINDYITNELIRETENYSKSLRETEYKNKIELLLDDLRSGAENKTDIAILLTAYIAESFVLLETPAKKETEERGRSKENLLNEKETREIKSKQELLNDTIKVFWAKKRKPQIEKSLADAQYNTYKMLSDVKDRNNSIQIIRRIHGKFEDVYQCPEIVSSYGKSVRWDLSAQNCRRSVIWAPNGSGKTTFLKGILFSSSFGYRSDDAGINTEDKNKTLSMQSVLQSFHNLDSDDYFSIFIEASYFTGIEAEEPFRWIYEIIGKQMRFDKTKITINDFQAALRKNNEEKKLIYLVDGFDEVDNKYKNGLLTRIEELLSSEYGTNAMLIITSRPGFETLNFNGFSYWNINQISFDRNENFIKRITESYCNTADGFSADKILQMISRNHYLREMVTTPEILINTVVGCAEYLHPDNENKNKDIDDIVDETIDELILRIDSRRFGRIDKYGGLDNFKAVYGVLAFDYFCGKTGIRDGNFAQCLKVSIKKLSEEHKYRQLRDMLNDDRKLTRMFFTWFSVLKSDGRYIRFLSDTFTEHFAAQRIITLLSKETDPGFISMVLQNLGNQKYNVFVMLCTMAYHTTDALQKDDLPAKIGCIFTAMMEGAFSEKGRRIYDLKKIRDMIVDIVLKKYGENIISNRLISDVISRNKDNIVEIFKQASADNEKEKKEYSEILYKLWD